MIGSNLHRLAYPDNFQRTSTHELRAAARRYEHSGAASVLSLQLRGEYLYTANGTGGFRVFDVANIDNKGFSERIITAPVSPLGQRAYVQTPVRDRRRAADEPCRSTTAATQQPGERGAADAPALPLRLRHRPVEGLVVVDVDMLADGDPRNNFLERVATFNPDGVLDGARYITSPATTPTSSASAAWSWSSIDDPLAPARSSPRSALPIWSSRAPIDVQFRYAFVTDARRAQGASTSPIPDAAAPRRRRSPLAEAGDLYVARTYAYVPAGAQGLAIVDVEQPEQARALRRCSTPAAR